MSRKTTLTYTLLAFFTTFLFIDRLMYVSVAVFVLLFLYVNSINHGANSTRNPFIPVFTMIAAIVFIEILLFTFTALSDFFSVSTAIKELSRVLIYAIIIAIMSRVSIELSKYLWVWRIILLVTIGIAIIQFTKIYDIDSFLIKFYGYSTQYYNTQYTTLDKFRCGSVFVNPNVFAGFLVASLGVYIFYLQNHNEILINKALTFLAIISGLVLAGSRTVIILSFIIILLFIYFRYKENVSAAIGKVFGIVFAAVLLYFIVSCIFSFDNESLSVLRMFKIKEGFDNSLGYKFEIYLQMLSSMNFLNWILGFGPFIISASTIVDFDFGYMTLFFGLFGLIIFYRLSKAIRQWSDTRMFGRRVLNTLFLVIFIMFGFTAGMYFNLRIFSMYLVMFLPAIQIGDERIA